MREITGDGRSVSRRPADYTSQDADTAVAYESRAFRGIVVGYF